MHLPPINMIFSPVPPGNCDIDYNVKDLATGKWYHFVTQSREISEEEVKELEKPKACEAT